MPPRYTVAPLGWLAVLGLAVLASSTLLRRERPDATPSPRGTDDLLVRIYS